MCGIVGLYRRGDSAETLLQTVESMNGAIFHRGPDESGHELLDESLVLAMRRLSIIDLAGGHQPMSAMCTGNKMTIVFNGEIYNHSELRAELETLGHRFATDHSDTEVLLHSYEEWGTTFLSRLNGMFAFALWDSAQKQLVLARDRFGKKPLYYTNAPTFFAFASELKSLFASGLTSSRLNPNALVQYLSYDYVLSPSSMIQGVSKLPPGHFAIYAGSQLTIESFYQPNLDELHISDSEAIEKLDELLEAAVRRRLVSDVPIGLFLSGGLDSSTIAYYLMKLGANLDSFSIGFEEAQFNESGYAAEVARHLGIRHHLRVFSSEDLLPIATRVSEILDEPMGDPSILPTYMLSTFARQRVTVALGGDGSDEFLYGYNTYRLLHTLNSGVGWLPKPLKALIAAGAKQLPGSVGARIGKGIEIVDMSPEEQVYSLLGAFGHKALDLLSPEFRATTEGALSVNCDSSLHKSKRWMKAYIDGYLPEDILVKVDRASMAASLEVRAPFLDPDLATFAHSLNLRQNLSPSSGKILLRRLMRGRVPDSVLDRRKQGFGVPLDKWFRGPLSELAQDLLSPSALDSSIFNSTRVHRLLTDHLEGKSQNGDRLWLLVQFQLWRQRWSVTS